MIFITTKLSPMRHIVLLMPLFLLALLAPQAEAFSGGGAGTPGNPYRITTCDELFEIGDDLAANYQLQNNIDCTDTATWNGGAGFFPLGGAATAFTGSFNGRNYVISNLYVERADDVPGEDPDDDVDSDYIGLFGRTSGALIRNVQLENAYVKGFRYVGALVGRAQSSTIENVRVNVSAAADAQNDCNPKVCVWARWGENGGGVAGYAEDSTITNVVVGGAVKGSGNFIGGVAGYTENAEISYATSTARIDGGWTVGGLVGHLNYSTITYSIASGDVVGYEVDGTGKNGESIGGLVGFSSDGQSEISHSSASGNVSGGAYIGGLVGLMNQGSVADSFATGDVTASSSLVGGLIGRSNGVDVSDAYATGDVSAAASKVGGLIGYSNGDVITDAYAEGDVTGDDEVGGFAGFVDSSSSISGAYATGDVSGDVYVGGFVGNASSSAITESYAEGNASGDTTIGGFAGLAGCGVSTITQSYATGDVSGESYAGGFAGATACLGGLGSTLDQVYATGDIEITDTTAGGLIGYSGYSEISNAYASGAVSGAFFIGGLVGEMQISTTTNTYARGLVDGLSTGGLVASITDSAVVDSNWDAEASGQSTSAGLDDIFGNPTDSMKSRYVFESYFGWDFTTIWGMNGTDNESYPFLRFQGFTDDPDYESPPDEEEESTGGRSSGGTRKAKTATTTDSVVVTPSPVIASVGVDAKIRDVIIKNRAIFEKARAAGIVLPQFVIDILSATSTSDVPVRDLMLGMSGEDVILLQNILIAQGHSIPAGATGLFGPQTAAALIAYQTKFSIAPAQGYFGAKTRAAMKANGISGLWW